MIGASAVGGLAGSIVSQGFGVATGLQDKFSWGAVALAGIGAGVGAALGHGGSLLGNVLRGAAGNAITQGIGVATGLQPRFDWAGIAAAGIGTFAGAKVGGAFRGAQSVGAAIGQRVAAATASDLANAATRSLIEGSDFGDNVIAALPDTIAQTAGGLLGDLATGGLAHEVAHNRADAQLRAAMRDRRGAIASGNQATAVGGATASSGTTGSQHRVVFAPILESVDLEPYKGVLKEPITADADIYIIGERLPRTTNFTDITAPLFGYHWTTTGPGTYTQGFFYRPYDSPLAGQMAGYSPYAKVGRETPGWRDIPRMSAWTPAMAAASRRSAATQSLMSGEFNTALGMSYGDQFALSALSTGGDGGNAYLRGTALDSIVGIAGSGVAARSGLPGITGTQRGFDYGNMAVEGAAAIPKGSANPITKAAASRGITLHSDKPGMLPDQLRALYPDTEFEFTKPGVPGQDVRVTGGNHPSAYGTSSWPEGVNYGDFKPGTANGAKTFRYDQKNKWNDPTHYIPYDPVTGKLLPH